jgi:NTP pyrophosphatase (non-canonical NTP hydrolase)
MEYHIYHIPGKKIGVTRNLNKRVTEQQGYASDEYEVLFTGEDINQISHLEIELQKSYGYRVDTELYKNLFKPKQMKVNATEQTTTFPMPLNKLKGRLADNMGLSWVTPMGHRVTLDKACADWIVANAITSHFNNERCFVYNKALQEWDKLRHNKVVHSHEDYESTIFDDIRDWAEDRGIYAKGDTKTQLIKLYEEAGELAQAVLKNDTEEFIDAIGDCVVVLTNLAHLGGVSIEDCIESAYNEISNRSGSMVNGSFVKITPAGKVSDVSFSSYLKSKAATL